MNGKINLAPTQRHALLTHAAGWIATGIGSGLVPRMQGTFGSAVALLPWWFAWRHLSLAPYILMLVIAFGIGVWACAASSRLIRFPDHRALVWDEFVGQWLTLLPVLLAPWWWMLAGFIVFRLFDVTKPWPISWLDRHVKGGMGVMLDDVLAGIFAAIVLAVGRHFLT